AATIRSAPEGLAAGAWPGPGTTAGSSKYGMVRPMNPRPNAGSTGRSKAAITSSGPDGQTATGRTPGAPGAGAVTWPDARGGPAMRRSNHQGGCIGIRRAPARPGRTTAGRAGRASGHWASRPDSFMMGILPRRQHGGTDAGAPAAPAGEGAGDLQHPERPGARNRPQPAAEPATAKEPFDIDEAFRRLRRAVAHLPKAAMFDLRDRGYATPF